MKKAFTLIEVAISITIFMILVLFLYKTLDQTKHSNKVFAKQEDKLKNKNRIYDIFTEDISESIKIDSKKFDKENNSYVTMTSSNTYHNSFYTNITYLVNGSNTLVRMESKEPFILSNPSFDFFENIYIDELVKDVEFFEVLENVNTKPEDNKSYLFIIKQKDKKRVLLNIYNVGNKRIIR